MFDINLDRFIAFARTGPAEKRQAAFLGIVRTVLFYDFGVEHHGICRNSSALIKKCNDALLHADHIRRHTDTTIFVSNQACPANPGLPTNHLLSPLLTSLQEISDCASVL